MCIFNYLLFVSFFLVSPYSYAGESLSQLMKQLKSDSAFQISYKETRTLELMDKPWYGNGYLYSIPPNIMIREQLQPKRLLMGIIDDKLFYFDPENNRHFEDDFDIESPRTLSIAVFKALINADESLLHRLYTVDYSTVNKIWTMDLKPKQDPDSSLNIKVFGVEGQPANRFEITQEEDEVSEFELQNKNKSLAIKVKIEQLSQTLQRK
ncbi:MAG: hypothetical protein HFP78_07090 [Methylococcales symbiont of Hymedesmia sp. n. MRB-2018]|nr:MAG: hypothetical protein HFP78_07090 [Methylococcales symbiont of Hymedesmia sp. n. MRB-2018]